MLLSTINLLSSGPSSLIDCMTAASVPSTLVKCLYLFFDLPEAPPDDVTAQSEAASSVFTAYERRVLLQKVLVQVFAKFQEETNKINVFLSKWIAILLCRFLWSCVVTQLLLKNWRVATTSPSSSAPSRAGVPSTTFRGARVLPRCSWRCHDTVSLQLLSPTFMVRPINIFVLCTFVVLSIIKMILKSCNFTCTP